MAEIIETRATATGSGAPAEYEGAFDALTARLAQVVDALDEQRKGVRAKGAQWGNVGDIAHVREQIEEIAEFIGMEARR